MISYEEALETILAAARPLPSESLALEHALGRYLSSDLIAAHDSPQFDNSAVDGFAVRASDLAAASEHSPVSLRIIASVFAGDDASGITVGPCECVRTMTGAMVAPGADAVVMQEDVILDPSPSPSPRNPHEASGFAERGGHASFTSPAKLGQAVRKSGEEYRSGDLLVPKGARVSPAVAALAASQGLALAVVGCVPRVGVMTTGSELVRPGLSLASGQIYESNSVAIAAAVASITGTSPKAVSVGDYAKDISGAAGELIGRCDVVVTTGGASVGEKDLVREAMKECGVVEKFWRIAMKPGKPVSFGVHPNGALVFALPGNPVSAQMTFALLVAPVIKKMMGAADPGPRFEPAVLGADVRRTPGRKEFLRAATRFEGGRVIADPLPGQGSHMARGVALADRLIVVEPDVDCLEAGTIVETVPLK